MSKARNFYEGTLGLAVDREAMEGVSYKCGDGLILVYKSEYASTNKATAVTFDVPMSAFEDEIRALRDKGISFLTFELEGVDWNQDVASMGDAAKGVWFTDPDGNIISVAAGAM